jgi:putative hemolysin
MKKIIYTIIIFGFITIAGLVFILRFVIGGPEDNWICVNNQWVKHGNPAEAMPTTGCGQKTQMANPAALYCKDQGDDYVIQTAPDGSQSGWCKLKDGRLCEEWEYYREHSCVSQITSPSPTLLRK